MTSSVNYPNQQSPAYSGVTINITNPTVNAGNPGCQPTFQVEQAQPSNSVVTNPLQQMPNNIMQNSTADSNLAQNPEQTQLQAYPPQYYLNNYNIQGPKNPEGDINATANVNQPKENPSNLINQKSDSDIQDNNMDTSKDIINDLDSRVNEENELKKNSKQKRVVALTNEYIMSLENYLNNPNSEIRLMAAKDILARLDEDKERYDDAALNALLNKMLQDPDKLVRIAALSAFSSQLASGNDFTVQLLTKMQNDPNADKEDVLQAANILLKMSAPSEVKYVPQKEQPNAEPQKEVQKPEIIKPEVKE